MEFKTFEAVPSIPPRNIGKKKYFTKKSDFTQCGGLNDFFN